MDYNMLPNDKQTTSGRWLLMLLAYIGKILTLFLYINLVVVIIGNISFSSASAF